MKFLKLSLLFAIVLVNSHIANSQKLLPLAGVFIGSVIMKHAYDNWDGFNASEFRKSYSDAIVQALVDSYEEQPGEDEGLRRTETDIILSAPDYHTAVEVGKRDANNKKCLATGSLGAILLAVSLYKLIK